MNSNDFFLKLPSSVKKNCLNGKFLMIYPVDELILKYKIDKNLFDSIFDILSNYIHILPISFYNHEPNKRGSGMFNETDLGYMCLCLDIIITLMRQCNERLAGAFPDAQSCRKGKNLYFLRGLRLIYLNW